MERKTVFQSKRLVASVRIMIETAKAAGRQEVTIDLAPLQALVELAEKASTCNG